MDAAPLDPLVAGVPRVLRHIAPPAAPWPAGVVPREDGTALLVDAALLPAGAFGDAADHVARPSEVFRNGDGHLALMPAVSGALVPEAVGGVGGAVTVAVSLLRGIAECTQDAALPGAWWLTPEGRPLFVPHRDGTAVRPASARLLRALAEGLEDADARDGLVLLADELEDPEPLPLDGWEERLFALGRPAAVHGAAAAPPTGTRRDRRVPTGGRRAPRRTAGVRGAVSDAGVALWRSVRRPRLRRRSLVLGVAAATALLVVVVGLAWPEPAEQSVPPGAAAVTPPAAPTEPGPAAPGEAPAEPGPRDLAAEALRLLQALRTCGEEAACRAAYLEDPATPLPPGPAVDGDVVSATVVDDLGGIAVVRVDGQADAGQIVLIVARDGEWLVRDVYDVADQP